LFNTGGVSISGVAIKLTYKYSEPSAPVDIQNIAVSSGLLGTGVWNCPVTQFSASAGVGTVEVSCFVTSTTGYSTEVDTQLFTFDMIAGSVPEFNPVELSFEPTESVIATKDTGEDVLLIPSSTGSFLVRAGVGSGGLDTGTTPSSTPTVGATGTPRATGLRTSTPIGTASATPVSTLPEAGVGTPTLFGLGAGAILIFGALLLAI
jgi:hypothetical protein